MIKKDKQLIENIRLLGRILGDVIREQDGRATYQLVEDIRLLSVAFRKSKDPKGQQKMTKLLKSLSSDQAVQVIRAFTYVSHLINLAEDHTKDGLWSIGNTHNNKIEYINSVFHSNDGGSVDFNFKAKTKGKTEIQLNKSMALDTMQRVTFVIEIE